MVLSNDTITTINYIKDVEYEYNIKLLLLLFILALGIGAIMFSKKINRETELGDYTFYFLNIFGYMVICFLPLYSFFLGREVPLSLILQNLAIAYTIIAWIMFFFILIWLGMKFLSYTFGIDFKVNSTKYRKENDYRRTE